MTDFLKDPLLADLGVDHGFGVRGASAPDSLLRPRQVHGIEVAEPDGRGGLTPCDADAAVSIGREPPVGVVTADCVPILVADTEGGGVAAIHAGWRGLAAGVVESGIARLATRSGKSAHGSFAAAIGPHIGRCCYEVDAPVIEAQHRRFGAAVERALEPSRPGHHMLALELLVVLALRSAGLEDARISTTVAQCTACDADRFESYRRDGEASGRLVHWITPARLA